MNHNQIMYFMAIVEHKNFSHAADQMFISQSSLSKQIKALEDELGVDLFFRDNYKIELTEAGNIFLPYAIKSMEEHSSMIDNLSSFTNKQMLKIRIGTIPILCYSGLINKFINAETNNHNIYIDFIEREQYVLLRMLERNQIDFAMVRIDYLSPDYYDFIPIMSEKIGVLCSIKNSLVSNEKLSLHNLSKETFILLNNTSGLYKTCMDAFKNAGFIPRINYVSSRHEAVLAMVNTGYSITLLPQSLLDKENSNKFKFIPLEEHITTTIALISKKENENNQMDNNFKKKYKEYVNQNFKNINMSQSEAD